MGFSKDRTGSAPKKCAVDPEVSGKILIQPQGIITNQAKLSKNDDDITDKLLEGEQGTYSEFAASILSVVAGWSYSDFETFKDMIAEARTFKDITINDKGIQNADACEIQIKNEPMLIEATAQVLRTQDKKVAIVCFRGTELTNLVSWLTDATTRKVEFHSFQVHEGFKQNLEAVWYGRKGVREHLLKPAMLSMDYDYDNTESKETDQDKLEAIYITGHSLGGAMALLAGLELQIENPELFQKLRGVYTYGAPMAVDSSDRDKFHKLVGEVTFRHVYFNDVVPHLPPLSTGYFDHVGVEYRFHPMGGWVQRKDGFLRRGRATQVVSFVLNGLVFGVVLDALCENIQWLEKAKMPWSFLDHSPLGYIDSLCNKEHRNNRGLQLVDFH